MVAFFFIFFAPRALNMALANRLTPYKKIAPCEMYLPVKYEHAAYDTFQIRAFFETEKIQKKLDFPRSERLDLVILYDRRGYILVGLTPFSPSVILNLT